MEEEKKELNEEEVKEEKKEETEEKKEDSKFVKAFTETKDDTAEFDKKDIEENSVMALLSYIWILWLIPLLAAPKSKFARYHANQGLVLFILEMIIGVVFGSLSWIPTIGIVFTILLSLCELLCLVLAVIGIVNAVQGQAKELPLIGKFKLIDYNKLPEDDAKEEKKEETEEKKESEEEK